MTQDSGLSTPGSPITTRFLVLAALIFLLTSCGPPPIIDLDLGEYENKLVVECYLKPNQKPSMLLTESQSYFAEPTLPIIDHATVTLTYGTVTDTLIYDPVSFEYSGPKTKRYYDMDYILRVEDKFGRTVSSTTRFVEPIAIDSLSYFYDGKDKARVITHFNDPAASADFYRITINSDSSKKWDRQFSDGLANGQSVSISSSYKFPDYDVAKVRLYRLTRDHYEFLRSVSIARRAAGSPISEPAPVQSNITGGLGIFTTLNWDRDTIRIEP